MKLVSSLDLKSSKGRKRKQISASETIKSLIEGQVMVKWTQYLRKKMNDNEGKETGVTPRDDTVWMKIFRDLREFYRILFKLRFHLLDYKTCEQADKCVIVLLNELGIETVHLEPYTVRKIFYFFHQTRLNSSDHYMMEHTDKEGEVCSMEIIEKYKDSYKAMFMIDPISMRLFYIVFHNFDYVYN